MAKTWLNVSEIVTSPEFSQTIQIKRHSNGRFINGRYIEDEEILTVSNCVVSAADEKTLNMVPEGDRNETMKSVYSIEKIYLTANKNKTSDNRTSDIILYNGDEYNVIAIVDADDYGYTKAIISKIGAS